MEVREMEQIDIIAKNTFHIDSDLSEDLWKGKNISIVAEKLNIWGKRSVDVSGKDYPNLINQTPPKADEGCIGKNGKDGRPGESGGNILIAIKEAANLVDLTLISCGGKGEDGEDGGDGGDGKPGKTVTEKELDALIPKYGSIRLSFESTFYDLNHVGWKKVINNYSKEDQYVYYVFRNEVDGRELYYTYGVDKGWLYHWYDLVVWMKGTDGRIGGKGGSNGIGGEGGNPGECNIINYVNGENFGFKSVCKNGKPGNSGKVGANGQFGINGNHMAFIDRPGLGVNNFYFGLNGKTRLALEYFSSNDKKRRINGYRKIVEKDSFCFCQFKEQKIPEHEKITGEGQKREIRSNSAKTTMKKSMVLNMILEKADRHKARLTGDINLDQSKAIHSHVQTVQEAVEYEQEITIVKEFEKKAIKIPQKKRTNKIKIFNNADYFKTEYEMDNLEKLLNQGKLQIKQALTRKKHDFTKFRTKVSNFFMECREYNYNNNQNAISVNDSKIENVACSEPETGTLWHHNVEQNNIDKVLKEFFREHYRYKINIKILQEIYDIYAEFDSTVFDILYIDKPYNKEWCVNMDWEIIDQDGVKFKNVMKLIVKQNTWFKRKFKELAKIFNKGENEILEGDGLLKERFGNPDFDFGTDKNKCIEAAKAFTSFCFQIKNLILFNQKLIIANLLCKAEEKNEPKKKSNEISFFKLDQLIEQCGIYDVNIDSEECKRYLKSKGFHCMAFRYIYSKISDTNIKIYENENYGTIELTEFWSGSKLLELYFNGKEFFNIIPDVQLERLIASHNTRLYEEDFEENERNLELSRLDYSKASAKTKFASHFSVSFLPTIQEWIDCYLAASENNSKLLEILHRRFEIDGNHLEIGDFQFLISTTIILQNEYKVPLNFICNLVASVSQHKLIDAFFVTRFESLQRCHLKNPCEILKKLEKISNNSAKVLLITKIRCHNIQSGEIEINEELLNKFLIMFRQSAINVEQLEKMDIKTWKLIAEKQKYFDVIDVEKDCDEMGYYVIYLRQQEKKDEAEMLKKLLTEEKYIIPQQFIAKISYLITSDEIVAKENLKNVLINIFTAFTRKGRGFSRSKPLEKHFFITDELDQAKLISKVQAESSCFKDIFLEKERTPKFFVDNIKSVHDEDDETRKKFTQAVLKEMDDPKNDVIVLLDRITNCIKKFHEIDLHAIQKLAIMYTIQSEMNLLSQVNTGEGKTYIVAAIAIIRAKKYKYVDIITSSPVLAKRDALAMKDIYEGMGLKVDHNCDEDIEIRKQAYKANIVYGEIGRFQRDYLLHNFYRKNVFGDRERKDSCVIIDEVDNMLLDNGNNMLYLNHGIPGMDLLESLFVHLQKLISFPSNDIEKDFSTDAIKVSVLSDLLGRISKEDIQIIANESDSKSACFNVWNYLVNKQIIDSDGYLMINISDFHKNKAELQISLEKITTSLHAKKIITCFKAMLNRKREISIPNYLIPFVQRHLTEYIENTKRAFFMQANEAYVVDVNRDDGDITQKPIIIDQNTGVDLLTSQWSEGLHQSIQIKHGCRVSPISMKAVFVSNVNYLKGYSKINGLSGTLGSIEESKTLENLYEAELVNIPTNKTKKFYEHVPVITKTTDEWIKAIFDEVRNQVKANRSVLIICQSIAKSDEIIKGLRQRFIEMENVDKAVTECYKNLRICQRETDKLEFNNERKLQPGRLIIATNLAGRGTDIKLSEELCKAGGLHVIISFIPENCRIEDQAYGRAARNGEPGSGQIITQSKVINLYDQPPSIFDLKIVRDNEEIQRLQSMKDFYEFHTKTEEECLTKFKEHCLSALAEMNNSKKLNNGILTEEEIIYFALLDEWAIWLDSQNAQIKQYTHDKKPEQKMTIMKSLKNFLKEHPISPVVKALKWVRCPQPLLSLILINIDNERYDEAMIIADQIIQEFPEFSGEACYYKGIILQKRIKTIKKLPQIEEKSDALLQKITNAISTKVNNITQSQLIDYKDNLPSVMCGLDFNAKIECEDCFLQAVQKFGQKSEIKQQLHTLISRLQKNAKPRNIVSEGYKNQTTETHAVYDCLSTNVYDMIGHPINYLTFAPDAKTIDDKYEAYQRFLRFEREGYVTPLLLNENILSNQYELLREKYMLPKTKVEKLFNDFKVEGSRVEFEGRTVLQKNKLKKALKLPQREEFWNYLVSMGCLKEVQEFYILKLGSNDDIIVELKNVQQLEKFTLHPHRIQLSDYDLTVVALYDANKIETAFEQNKLKLQWLESMEFLVKNATGIIDMDTYKTTYFLPNFDYFSLEDLSEWLNIDIKEAKWIIQNLIKMGTIRKESLMLTKINNNITEIPENMQEIHQTLLYLAKVQMFDDFNLVVASEFFKQLEDEVLEIYQQLANDKIIVPYQKDLYFQDSNFLECSNLPKCLKNDVKMFLYHKFAYTFAYDFLFKSLEGANNNPSISKSIPLPWKPYDALFKDLIKYGFVHDQKIELKFKEFLGKRDKKTIKNIEEKTKSRLYIKSATLIPTRKYFINENVDAALDVQCQTINTMKQVGKIDENNSWIFWWILKMFATLFLAWSLGSLEILVNFIFNFNSHYATALTVLAIVGSSLYYFQLSKAKYITQNARDPLPEQYYQLVEFHSNNLKLQEKQLNESKLVQVFSSSIISKMRDILQLENAELAEKWNTAKQRNKKFGPIKFIRLGIQNLNQPRNWKLVNDAINTFLTRIKPALIGRYFKILNEFNLENEIDVESAIEAICKDDEKFKIELGTADKKLLTSLAKKIVDDCITAIEENKENGEDFDEEDLSKEMMKLNLESEDDSDIFDTKNTNSDEFIETLKEQMETSFKQTASAQLIKPLIKLFSNYIESIHPLNAETSKELSHSLENDKNVKRKVEEKHKQVQAFQSMPFIVLDLQRAIQKQYQQTPSNSLLKVMIANGHALHKCVMPLFINILFDALKECIPDLTHLSIIFQDNDKSLNFNKEVSEPTWRKNTQVISLMLNQNHFFFCQNDSNKFLQIQSDYIGSSLYESIFDNCSKTRNFAKMDVEAFRSLVLQHLE